MSLRPSRLLRLMLLCLCSVFLFPLALSAKASAYSDPIAVTRQADTVHFPGSIDFTMSATDAADSINNAIIYITYKDTIPGANMKQYAVPVSKPAQIITLHWHENTGGDNFHAPGTPVEYFWFLQDTANHQFSSAAQAFTTIDTRFSWQHLAMGLLQVNWYSRPRGFGQLLLNDANNSIMHISQVLGNGLLYPINLWVYASNQDFHGALAPGTNEWVGGEAHPVLHEAFISVIDANDDTLVRDMPHELTHLVFHQLVAQGSLPPTWFDEGMAVYNQLFHEPEMKARFEQALRDHALIRLDTLNKQFPADSDMAYLAYAQSWDLVSYMYNTYGQAKMTQLIKKMNDSQSTFDQDLRQSLGEDEIHLENQWHLHLGQPGVLTTVQITPTPNPLIQSSQTQNSTVTDNTAAIYITIGTLLLLLAISGVLAILLYRGRKRQQVAQVEAPQTYLPFFYPTPEPAFFAQPAQTLVPAAQPPSTPPNASKGWWQPDFPAIDQEHYGEYGESTSTPFGTFQENLNSQPMKKAPQE